MTTEEKCEECAGKGRVDCDACYGGGDCHHCGTTGACGDCDGKGSVQCDECSGTGKIEIED